MVKITFTSGSSDDAHAIDGISTAQTGASALAILGTPSYTDSSSLLEKKYYFSGSNVCLVVGKFSDKVYSTGIYDPAFWGY